MPMTTLLGASRHPLFLSVLHLKEAGPYNIMVKVCFTCYTRAISTAPVKTFVRAPKFVRLVFSNQWRTTLTNLGQITKYVVNLAGPYNIMVKVCFAS
jgi:hypothetical protein